MAIPQPQRIYVAFEGGGAKGVAHIGALAAFEAEADDVRIAGVAGTSAGAIVAALVAAGWTSKEIADPAAHDSILKRVRKAGGPIAGDEATDLIGPRGWRAIWTASRMAGVVGWVATHPSHTILGLVALTLASVIAGAPWWAVPGLASAAATVVAVFFAYVASLKGLASLDGMIKALDFALALRLYRDTPRPEHRIGEITFGELADHASALPLRIVATDLDSAQLRLFPSTRADLAIPVARAVAASACVPGIFAPVQIAITARNGETVTGRFVDGGLVSNLPAWVFDTELRMEDYSSVFAVGIADDDAVAERRTAFSDTLRLIRAAVFGAGSLNLRGIPQLHFGAIAARNAVPPPTKTGMLDFDMSWKDIAIHIETGHETAERRMLQPAIAHQRVLTEAAEQARLLIEELLDDIFRDYLGRAYGGPCRAALLDPFGTPPTGLRIRYTAGYVHADRDRPPHRHGDPDDRMSLPIGATVTGSAWSKPSGVEVWLGGRLPRAQSLSEPRYDVLRYRTEVVAKGFIAGVRLDLQDLIDLDHDALVLQVDGPNPLSDLPDSIGDGGASVPLQDYMDRTFALLGRELTDFIRHRI